MIKRSMLSILILVALFGVFAANGVEAKTTVTIWTAFPELHEYVVAVAEQYMKENPDIDIVATLYPQRAQEEKVAVALPTGQAADLIELDKMMLYPYYVDGYLEPLTGEMETWVKENFPADGVEAVRAEDGNIYCFPWFVSLKVMFYNKTYFEEAGITKTPETVDEMMEMAQKLVKRDENGQVTRAGIDLRLSGGGFGTAQKFWCQSMIPYGAQVIEKVGDKWRAGYDNEAGMKAIQMYLNAVYRDNVESFDIKSDAEGFGLGLSGMFQRESWVIGYLAQNAPELEYGAFLMPKGPGDWGTVGNTMALGLNKASEHKEEALAFARYLMNDDNSRKMIDETGWQPFRAHVDYSDIIKKYPVLQTFVDGLSTEGHRVYDYENIPLIAEIHNRFAERLMRSFKMKELYEEPGQRERSVYLPKGPAGWYDFHSGQWYQAGQTITVDAPLDRCPLFVREGGIIPLTDPGRNTQEIQECVELRCYPLTGNGEASYELFDDDGETWAYRTGQYALLQLQMHTDETQIMLHVEQTGNYPFPYRQIAYWFPETEQRQIIINDRPYSSGH